MLAFFLRLLDTFTNLFLLGKKESKETGPILFLERLW